VPADRHLLPSRGHAWRFAAVGVVLLLAGLALARVIAADWAAQNARDLPVNQWFYDLGQSQAWTAHLAEAVSWFAGGARNVVVVPVVLIVLLVARQWRWAIFLAVSSQAGLLVSSGLKAMVSRERPTFIEHSDFQRYLSFPSGHTFAGVTVWVAMGIICWFLLDRPWSTLLGIVLVVIGLLNGPSRLILGKHWLTDVLGAWLVASGWLLVVWAAWLWWLAPRDGVADAGPAVALPN
jgi:undecaprenyl-diphosphatase